MLALVAVAATPALAAAGNHSTTFNRSWLFKSAPLARCITITVSGTFTYTDTSTPSHTALVYNYTNIKVNNPTIRATIQGLSAGTCTGTATLNQITLQQSWAGYSCSFNPSISVGYPWAIAVTAWPSCSSRNQAWYSTTVAQTLSSYSQNNTGSPVTYGPTNTSTTTGPCYGVFPSVTAWVGGNSDSFGATSTASAQICLPF